MTMRWNRSRWVPRASATDRFDGSAWDTATTVSPGWRLRRSAMAWHDPGLHAREGLAARKAEAARIALHGRPLRELHQLLELLPGPLAEVALDQAARHSDPQPEGGAERGGRLPGPLQRARRRRPRSGGPGVPLPAGASPRRPGARPAGRPARGRRRPGAGPAPGRAGPGRCSAWCRGGPGSTSVDGEASAFGRSARGSPSRPANLVSCRCEAARSSPGHARRS